MSPDFHNACNTILSECKNPYARAYAGAGLYLTDPNEIRVQSLYILNNISHWRGDTAKQVRATLKECAK